MTSDTLQPAWLDRRLFPFPSKSIVVDDNSIHYVDVGKGPTLLLLHGNGSWSFLYRHMIADLSRHYRCIALDYPGFGLSVARPDYGYRPADHSAVVEEFVDALDLRDIRLTVQDWGGPIGLGFAGRRPELIQSLFICNTWAWPAQDIAHLAWFARLMGSPPARLAITRVNLFARFMVPAAITHPLTAAEHRAYTGPFPTVASRWPLALFPKEILRSRSYLAQVETGLAHLHSKPVTLLWGDADTGFRASELHRFQRHFPAARTRMLPGARHYVQEDAPTQICNAIRESDERHTPSPATALVEHEPTPRVSGASDAIESPEHF